MTSRYTSTASRTIGSRRPARDIVAMSSPWTRPRREVIWKAFGTWRASGRRLWTARARAERRALGQQPPVLRPQHRSLGREHGSTSAMADCSKQEYRRERTTREPSCQRRNPTIDDVLIRVATCPPFMATKTGRRRNSLITSALQSPRMRPRHSLLRLISERGWDRTRRQLGK
jgi:hypothetical protein